ncbi:tRNA (guanosine(37)-N1)-methyltransferase TrmD [Carboxydochorda subterranea]|uniref:tRNA (guanine-N(1)-)-methyltransferase n=1 Tax=Carboxydichorda subterranea TaxID=3109565 RepID=A0ABZ1C021_9FIRM|nr:tRNA (guanosine(37)-N1)-methyltransferase TrmD [Limnochorda sp. L945t]WRP18429.1 tRNA (guanosine(37)-N1)-methyltransferase TrmD [Limnochorda sp. L945t]
MERYPLDIVTLAPAALAAALAHGVTGRAWQSGLVRIRLWDLREFTRDPHRKVDDVPFGGGSGMVLMPEPMVLAAEHAISSRQEPEPPAVLVLAAAGRPFDQAMAMELARRPGGVVLLCGRYEGIDARVAPALGAEEVAVGEMVLSAGEPAALAIVDAVVRLLPGALGNPLSAAEESLAPGPSGGLLEYPQYTRPRRFRSMEVPPVLLEGNHQAIAAWRRRQSLWLTWRRRPRLLEQAALDEQERALVERWRHELSPNDPPW